MEITKDHIQVWKFENGHILIGHDENSDLFFISLEDGIFTYNASEMKEIYNFSIDQIS